MNCQKFRELISERTAGELSLETAGEFDSHQQTCQACRDAMRDWQQMESWLRTNWPAQDPPTPFFLPASKARANWLSGVRSWVSAGSMAIVAVTVLLLVVFRPSIQLDRHQLSLDFGHQGHPSRLASTTEAMNSAQIRAMVETEVQESIAAESRRLQSAPPLARNSSSEEVLNRLAQLGVQLEMVKESQASLWQQVQEHGLYLQSAWQGSSERIKPDENQRTNRP